MEQKIQIKAKEWGCCERQKRAIITICFFEQGKNQIFIVVAVGSKYDAFFMNSTFSVLKN